MFALDLVGIHWCSNKSSLSHLGACVATPTSENALSHCMC